MEMKRVLSTISVAVIMLVTRTASAEVIETNSYKDVLPYIDSKTLFVTDLDNTLIQPAQTLGSDQWGAAVQASLRLNGLADDEATDLGVGLFALVQMKTKVIPVEHETPAILQRLAHAGVQILGLTARPLFLVDRTIEQLKSIDVELPGVARKTVDVTFAKSTAAYRNGVLFVGAHNSKGRMLKEFIANNPLPGISRIVFIDDKSHHAQDVDQAFNGTAYTVKSFRYGATDAAVKAYDPATAQKEWTIFNCTGELVSDERVLPH